MRSFLRLPTLACALLVLTCALLISGCLGEAPPNVDWATPAGNAVAGDGDGIQAALDTYAQALVGKDRDRFASILDSASPDFTAQELQRFDRLTSVPFDSYYLKLLIQSETVPGTVAAKVATSYTLRGSFSDLPDSERTAYFLVKREDGWKLSGDAGEQALGKRRDARFEDFGQVEVLEGERSIVLYHDAQRGTAEQALSLTEAAVPRLEEIISSVKLPKVPIYVYASKGEIDQTYPGKWHEWTGGAARQRGKTADQGGEIIIDAEVFSRTNTSNPGYNQQMLAHELTHIALFPLAGNRTPPFLIEGLADYVAGVEDYTDLRKRLRDGSSFNPTLRDIYQPGGFTALLTTAAATLAYEEADSAVALLEKKYGNQQVLALLREFKQRESDTGSQDTLVDEVFRTTLDASWSDFENEWRQYVTGG